MPKTKKRQGCGAALEYNAVNAVTRKSAVPHPARRSSIITYDGLPISSGGAHSLRTRNPLAALAQVRNFIASCTDCLHPPKVSVEVITGGSVPAESSVPLVEKLTAELGTPGRLRSCGAGNIAHCWPIAAPQIDAYVTLIAQLSPLPVLPYRLQPITVAAVFNFHLLDSRSRAVLPWQGAACYGNFSPVPGQLLGESQLYARISGRSTVSLFLSFPFADVSEGFLATAGFVRAHLPFPLSPNHWKRWRLTKNGKGYTGRRLSPQQVAPTP